MKRIALIILVTVSSLIALFDLDVVIHLRPYDVVRLVPKEDSFSAVSMTKPFGWSDAMLLTLLLGVHVGVFLIFLRLRRRNFQKDPASDLSK